MKVLKLLVLILALGISSAWAETPAPAPAMPQHLPEAAMTKSDEFVKSIFTKTPEDLYAAISEKGKANIPPDQFKSTLKQIQQVMAKPQTICRFSRAQFHPGPNAFSLLYDVKVDQSKYELTVVLDAKNSENYTVEGVHLRNQPRKLWDFNKAGFGHYLIVALMVVCILSQIATVVYFGFQKKIWFALAALVGFPAGLGLNWTTGVIIYRFGVSILPVGFTHPANMPDYWAITVFFPLGLGFLIYDLWKNLKKGTSSN